MTEGETSHTASTLGPLSRKVGGQPAWVWIVGVVVLAVAAQWYRARSQAVKAQAAQVAQSNGQAAVDSLIGNGTGLPAGAGPPQASTPPPMSTEQWLASALNAAKSAGEDPIAASRALSNFLNGRNLSYADTLVVNAALDAIGTPPGYSAIPPGNWQTRPLPASDQSPSTLIGFVRPAGSAATFAQYANGSLVSLGDADSVGSAIASAAAAGVNTNVRVLPTSDPIWQNSDVVQNQDQAVQYLWGQHWAQYVDPNNYRNTGRPDIVTDPAAIQAANAAWQRSLAVLPSTWDQYQGIRNSTTDNYANAAFAAAFPQYSATGGVDSTGHTVSGVSG